MKSEFSSFDTAKIVDELEKKIIGARIEKIYQTNPLTLIFRFHQPNQPTFQMLIEAGKRIHLTKYAWSKPIIPPPFCMALRKHLRNGKIAGIQQYEFERVVTMEIGTRKGTFLMVSELFGDGNIILVNPQGTILYALNYRKMRDRTIKRGENYKHAPLRGKNPFHLRRPDYEEIKDYGRLEIVRALTILLSIGGLYAEEILLHAEIDKNTSCEALTKQQMDSIFNHTETLISKLKKGKSDPNIVVNEKDEWIDVTPFPLKRYANLTIKLYESFDEALDEYYSKAVTIEKVADAKKEHIRELTKLRRTLEDQQKKIEDSKKIIQQTKTIGNIIYTHLGELQLLAKKIIEEKRQDRSWEQIIASIEKEKKAQCAPFIYVQSLDSRRQMLNVSIDNKSFSLDLKRSIQANAALFYEKAKKTERKQGGAKKAMQETKTKIEEIKRNLIEKTEKVIQEAPNKKREKAWHEKFRWFNSSDGFLVIGGRDATTNEVIIKKHTEPKDIVFHADVVGAPFVVVKTEGRFPSEQTMLEAAQFAASHSKAWKEWYHTIDVYWVHPNQLSKSPPHGQYLQKGAFIIHGKRNYLKKISLTIAVGVISEENQIIIVGGPTELIKKRTTNYVKLIPGQESSTSLIKQIRKLLAEKAPSEWQKQIMAKSLEEIRNLIPSGRSAIAQRK